MKTYSTFKTIKTETTEYGNVLNSHLVTMFGDEMTYNELKLYAENHTKSTVLKVEKTKSDESHFIRVWFDDQIVLEKNACCECSPMLNELNEYDDYLIQQEERDRAEYGCYYEDVCEGEVIPGIAEAKPIKNRIIKKKPYDSQSV